MQPAPSTILDQARVDYLAGNLAAASRALAAVPDAPAIRAMFALCRVRQVMLDHAPRAPVALAEWAGSLESPWEFPDLEADREFARGWLACLDDESERAERHLGAASAQFRAAGRKEAGGECDYWLARVQVARRHPDPQTGFEAGMRRWGGSPRLTGWYVDLLWRLGQPDRAAQVWQTVRGNARVAAVDEAPLLEARFLLGRGETMAAEHALTQARCRGAVVQVERGLLLAWLLAERNQIALADRWLRQAERGPYPARTLRAWRTVFNHRHGIAPGTDVAWLLHHAAQAWVRRDAGQAMGWLIQAFRAAPEFQAARPQAGKLQQAFPELERLAIAHTLARAACFSANQPVLAGEVLDDAVRLLQDEPRGQAVLAAAIQEDEAGVRCGLEALAEQEDLSPRLDHHLALIFHRAACYGEMVETTAQVERCWRLAWRCWLLFLRSLTAEAGMPTALALLGRLLDVHREYIGDYLSRNQVDAARHHWGYVEGLSALKDALAPGLAEALAGSVAHFRDQLTASYLTRTRDVMKSGDIPEGWRADYDRGLDHLKRLLSLDRDNVRLLTALVEICGDWFLDCYNNEAGHTLCQQVERFTPFALKLARLVEQPTADLAARVALAEFYKYRGFIAADRGQRIALYRQASRFDPGNENVHALLAEIENDTPAVSFLERLTKRGQEP